MIINAFLNFRLKHQINIFKNVGKVGLINKMNEYINEWRNALDE